MTMEWPAELVDRALLDVSESVNGRRAARGGVGSISVQVREVDDSLFSVALECSAPKVVFGSNWDGLSRSALPVLAAHLSEVASGPVDDWRVRRLDLCIDAPGAPAREILESLTFTDPQRAAVVSRHMGLKGSTVTVHNRSGGGTLYDKQAESLLSAPGAPCRLRFEARERSSGKLRGPLRLSFGDLAGFDHREVMRDRFTWAFGQSVVSLASLRPYLDSSLTDTQKSHAVAYVALVSAGIDPRSYYKAHTVSRMRTYAGSRGTATAEGLAWDLSSLFDWESSC